MFPLYGMPKYVSANNINIELIAMEEQLCFVFSTVIDLKHFEKPIPTPLAILRA
jgi:hypothetical protein